MPFQMQTKWKKKKKYGGTQKYRICEKTCFILTSDLTSLRKLSGENQISIIAPVCNIKEKQVKGRKAEVKDGDGKEKWQAIIKASHPNMTQSAFARRPTATVRNTSTVELIASLSTLQFHTCENQHWCRTVSHPMSPSLSNTANLTPPSTFVNILIKHKILSSSKCKHAFS